MAVARSAPLAPWQEGMWLHTQLNPDEPVYTIARPMVVGGDLDEGRLRRALEVVTRRHETLRTTIQPGPPPVQSVADAAPVDLRTFSADGHDAATRLAVKLAGETFDLAAGPLWRAALIRYAPDEQILLLTMHHLIADGWSVTLLCDDIAAAYDGVALAELPTQYADFATERQRRLTAARRERQLAFWRDRLHPPPPPLDLPRASDHRGEREILEIGGDLRDRLVAHGLRHRVTLFATMLGGFACLLGVYCGARDVVVGCPVSQRQRPELERVLGLFINTAPVRVRLDDDLTFAELTVRVREQMLDAYDNLDVPYAEVLRATGPVPALFQVTDFHANLLRRLGDAEVTPFDLPVLPLHHALEMSVIDHGDRLRVHLIYPPSTWDRQRARDFLGYYENVLTSATGEP
ncbi:condensation domain-containing protein [Micromonospora sp. WMMD1120]|uniref:condensation domain-containing protein n=1 Tax=Micromonospora sp. WMMD1120 TaxID=3016106 RepID=UPI0024172C83|nr:condensation domain-containing protein [Micromonospora sp. WMMD1120]MDG4807544.1 condensation domain-containing protein [Micromonospora sp. WMMD1120]